jgi:hypothetical protein
MAASRWSRKAVMVTASLRTMISVRASPVRTSKAATREALPWRRYSNSSRAGCPGVAGRPGWRRDRAAIAVFSSTDSTIAPSGGLRYRSHTSATRSQKSGVSRRVSRPRTRCGLRSRPARIRPTWEAEMPANPVPSTFAAIARATRPPPGAGARWWRWWLCPRERTASVHRFGQQTAVGANRTFASFDSTRTDPPG